MPNVQVQSDPIINLPNLYKYGMTISNFSTGSSLLVIGPGMCRDSQNSIDIEIGSTNVENVGAIESSLTINGNVSGPNGLDAGSFAPNTMYAIYVIADSRYYLPIAGLLTLASNSLPIIPKGYDSYRLIGYWSTTNTGVFFSGAYIGISNDMIFWYKGTDTRVLNAGNETMLTNIDLTFFVPPVNNTLVTLMGSFIPAAAGDNYGFRTIGATSNDTFQFGQVSNVEISNQSRVNSTLVSSAPTIQYVVSSSSDSLSAWVNGFNVSV